MKILNKNEIQKLLTDVKYELDIFSLRNPNCQIVIQPNISNIKNVLCDIQIFLENLLKQFIEFPSIEIPESLFQTLNNHFEKQKDLERERQQSDDYDTDLNTDKKWLK